VKTKVKVLRRNRLDANSFVSVKLWRQTKTTPIFVMAPIKNIGTKVFLWTDSNWKHVVLGLYADCHCSRLWPFQTALVRTTAMVVAKRLVGF